MMLFIHVTIVHNLSLKVHSWSIRIYTTLEQIPISGSLDATTIQSPPTQQPWSFIAILIMPLIHHHHHHHQPYLTNAPSLSENMATAVVAILFVLWKIWNSINSSLVYAIATIHCQVQHLSTILTTWWNAPCQWPPTQMDVPPRDVSPTWEWLLIVPMCSLMEAFDLLDYRYWTTGILHPLCTNAPLTFPLDWFIFKCQQLIVLVIQVIQQHGIKNALLFIPSMIDYRILACGVENEVTMVQLYGISWQNARKYIDDDEGMVFISSSFY